MNTYEARHIFQQILLYVALAHGEHDGSDHAACYPWTNAPTEPARGEVLNRTQSTNAPFSAEGRVDVHAPGMMTKKALTDEDLITFLDESASQWN